MDQFFALLLITGAVPVLAQEDCDNIVTIPELATQVQEWQDAYHAVQVDTIIMVSEDTYEVKLSNGSTTTQVQGCMDADYLEYNPLANTDDGSCAALVGCSESDFVSMDGYDYEVVQIGDQCWFAENLRTTVYADGMAVTERNGSSEWQDAGENDAGARSKYWRNNGDQNDVNWDVVPTHGWVYNWYAVNSASGLCPAGWHVPTDAEWKELEMELGMSQGQADSWNCRGAPAGTKLKSTSDWYTSTQFPSIPGTDDYGFSALGGGFRYYTGESWNFGWQVNFWTSSSYNGGGAYVRYLRHEKAAICRHQHPKGDGNYVRCLRDAGFNEVQGCTDPAYTEYSASANADDGSCTSLLGCTDPDYDEYNAEAMTDDGSCASLLGCTDAGYDEYNDEAVVDDGSCTSLLGCTDPDYDEYNAEAMTDDGSCTTLIVNGCTNPAYTEYDASANADDGSCATLVGCSESDYASMDGYNYNIVQIGNQCWFSENLRTATYADGTTIPLVTDDETWSGLSSSARCYYDNDFSNVATYGALYNWYAVDNSRGLCPSGWHVPSDGEWTVLSNFLGGNQKAPKLKASPNDSPGWDGNNASGFTALPGGYRNSSDNYSYDFTASGDWCYLWSSSSFGDPNAWLRSLGFNNPFINRGHTTKSHGFSVRCLRDAE